MGYFFLSLVLLSGAAKGFCGKKMGSSIVTSSDSMLINVFRMVLCIFIGFFLMLAQSEITHLGADVPMLLVCALSGVTSSAFVVSWLLSVKRGAYMMVEVFLLIGVLVPLVLCRIFFGEEIGPWQIVGMVILLAAVFIMCTYNTSIKGKMTIGSLLLLLLCGLSNGVADFSQKLFVKMQPGGSVAAFNFYTYVFAALTLAIAYFVFRANDMKGEIKPRRPVSVIKPVWYYVLIMAVCLFANSFFKTQAAKYLSAVQLYPLNNGGAVMLSLFMAAVFFKERINIRCIVGICLSFGALLMINFL